MQIEIEANMDQRSEPEKNKDKQVLMNVADFDILRKDEAFWQRTVKTLAKEQISETKDEISVNEDASQAHHPEKVFSIFCKCCKCLIFRKLIIGIHVENEAYNDLWEKLKEIISSYYYTMLPSEQDSVINQKYQELQKNSCGIKWFSDGSIDVKKNIHVSMGNYCSLSNEMTFIIVFNMLILRDRHQLFELLCLQLTSIILAYREGIKQMTKCSEGDEEYYKPEEFLNYILNGYEKITEIAETLTPLVIEMRDHLQKFSLSWQLMNQCMYYRFLYVDIENRMADCILRLKDAVDDETYKSFVYRFIKFDEEMTQIGQVWEVALVALELYRKSTPEQVARVERIGMIREIVESLRSLKEIEENATISNQALALDWIVSSEKDDVWMGVLNALKSEKHYRNAYKHPCKCWACLMADGNIVPDICAIPDDSPSEVQKKRSSDECYHLAWGVFSHLKDREPYNKQFIYPDVFCVFNDPPCQQLECQVATNLIIGSYPLSFTKFLLRTYQPLSRNDREKFLKVPSQSLIRKFCLKKGGAAAKEIMQEADEINHSFLLLNMFWDEDDIADPMLRAGLAAALAENFRIEVKFPQKHIILSYFYALFRTSPSGDIVMDLEWLEKINVANLFKSFGVISTGIHESNATLSNPSNSVEAIEMTLNELKISAEISAGSSNALDLVQFSMKEVADKLSSISLTDDKTENAKKVLENEIKKPLVEALKLAASNKKLEAELKSLQKEHNMLKDMVKGLEQIHGEKKEVQVTVTTAITKSVAIESNPSKCGHSHSHHNHSHSQSGSSSPSTSDVDHGKDLATGVDCVCYYCTLFGKNQDLMNSRSTETRDRLRKRLHSLQSQKDISSKTKNLKNISLLLKNGTAAAAAASTPPKVVKCSESVPHKCSTNGPMPNVAPMKMKVELELQQRKKKANLPKPNYTNKPEDVKIQRATEINLKSLENLLEYIEGPSSQAVVEQKKAEEAAVKKQQKKVKQFELKVRRQIDTFVEVLGSINADIQTTIIDSKQFQHQMSQLKSGKGKNKDPRKIKNVQEKLSELNSRRSKLENEIKSILGTIKELNPNIDLHQECADMKSVVGILPPPPPQPVQPVQPVQPKPVKVQVPIESPPLPPQPQVRVQRPIVITKIPDEDPAKRMVTIRRINLPHAEPQVTVTAKGTTPDMDQLLYTFVNGQLVPASSLSPSAFQNGSIQLFMSSNGQTKMVVDNCYQQKPTKGKPESTNLVTQPMQQTTEKGKKKSLAQEKPIEKSKSDNKKKTEPPQLSKKEAKKQAELLKVQEKENVKKQTNGVPKAEPRDKAKKEKKPYIDPEFAANPFKLLDDEDYSDSGSEESVESLDLQIEDASETPVIEVPKVNGKKSKEEKKAAKKQTAAAKQTAAKVEKSVPTKAQKPLSDVKGKNDRRDSTASATSSTATKETKSSKKKKNALTESIVKSSPPVSKPTLMPQQLNSSSIMDQLNRGVRVEGLRLPPGITLTKVAPSDAVGLKRESINKIAQPMQDFSAPSKMPSNESMPHADPNGIIMVESNPHALNSKGNVPAESSTGNKKKNKKKKGKSDNSENNSQGTQQQHQDRIVTLKNPMFFNNPAEPMSSMMRNIQTPPFVSPMAPEPQSASIVRNENGMYTIRNPSFQNAFGGAAAPNAFVPRPQPETVPARTYPSSQFSSFENETPTAEPSIPKCSSVIGSEMKNVLQRRKEQEFAHNMDTYSQYNNMRPSQKEYSHFGNSGVNFNNNGTNCDDSFMPQQQSGFQPYNAPMMSNYEDLRLQPGQMLNSEVTIHNVTESKIFQNQAKKTPPPIGTPRNGNCNMETVGTLFGDLVISRPTAPTEHAMNGNDKSIFASGQSKIGDNDIKPDVETFKRFDFNHAPPKQQHHGMKCNISETQVGTKKMAMSLAIGDEFDRKQNSTNSNSPISVTSLDESIFENEQKLCNAHQKPSFYSSHHNFSDDKSSGSSSLFSSGI